MDLSVINTLAATVAENEAIGRKAGKAIALGVGAGLGTIGPGIGVGYIFGKVIESVDAPAGDARRDHEHPVARLRAHRGDRLLRLHLRPDRVLPL